MSPQRFQRHRTPGWRAPDGAIYVGRPSQWGNPFTIDQETPAALAVRLFYRAVKARDRGEAFQGRSGLPTSALIRRELRGKDLLCWCPVEAPCHADILLDIANADDWP